MSAGQPAPVFILHQMLTSLLHGNKQLVYYLVGHSELTQIMGHSPEVGPAQFFLLNILHEKGRVLSNIPPETI